MIMNNRCVFIFTFNIVLFLYVFLLAVMYSKSSVCIFHNLCLSYYIIIKYVYYIVQRQNCRGCGGCIHTWALQPEGAQRLLCHMKADLCFCLYCDINAYLYLCITVCCCVYYQGVFTCIGYVVNFPPGLTAEGHELMTYYSSRKVDEI